MSLISEMSVKISKEKENSVREKSTKLGKKSLINTIFYGDNNIYYKSVDKQYQRYSFHWNIYIIRQ